MDERMGTQHAFKKKKPNNQNYCTAPEEQIRKLSSTSKELLLDRQNTKGLLTT